MFLGLFAESALKKNKLSCGIMASYTELGLIRSCGGIFCLCGFPRLVESRLKRLTRGYCFAGIQSDFASSLKFSEIGFFKETMWQMH